MHSQFPLDVSLSLPPGAPRTAEIKAKLVKSSLSLLHILQHFWVENVDPYRGIAQRTTKRTSRTTVDLRPHEPRHEKNCRVVPPLPRHVSMFTCIVHIDYVRHKVVQGLRSIDRLIPHLCMSRSTSSCVFRPSTCSAQSAPTVSITNRGHHLQQLQK